MNCHINKKPNRLYICPYTLNWYQTGCVINLEKIRCMLIVVVAGFSLKNHLASWLTFCFLIIYIIILYVSLSKYLVEMENSLMMLLVELLNSWWNSMAYIPNIPAAFNGLWIMLGRVIFDFPVDPSSLWHLLSSANLISLFYIKMKKEKGKWHLSI